MTSVDKFGHVNIAASSERWSDIVRRTSSNLIAAKSLSVDIDGHYDAGLKRVKNVAYPITQLDAVPKSYVEERLVKLEGEIASIQERLVTLQPQAVVVLSPDSKNEQSS